jgi:hypothetical protein
MIGSVSSSASEAPGAFFMRNSLWRWLFMSGVLVGQVALSCGGASSKTSGGDGGGSDGTSPKGGRCAGAAPGCCVLKASGCACPHEAPFTLALATCSSGAWVCANGFELESLCQGDAGGGSDGDGGGKPCGIDEAGAYSPPPACYGTDETKCCVPGGTGNATCVDGQWMCGSARPSGCNGMTCPADAGDGG